MVINVAAAPTKANREVPERKRAKLTVIFIPLSYTEYA
jgi:hypothetical protein